MISMKKVLVYILLNFALLQLNAQANSANKTTLSDSLNGHKVLLDAEGKIISWMLPQSKAYSQLLYQRWNFIKTNVPNSPGPEPRSDYPQYFFIVLIALKTEACNRICG